jgi:calcineurin-like phosphoesterase family protein
MTLARAFVLFALLVSVRAFAAPMADGPYVIQSADGGWIARWVEGDDSAPQTRDQRLSKSTSLNGRKLTIPAVGNLPAFTVALRTPETGPRAISPDQVTLPKDSRLFVVADTHGEFEILVELLRKHGVIDNRLQWSFGKGHLAVLGDAFDRGPNHTEIFWLLYKLEAQAKRAGGGLHLLLGNHETLVLLGARQYLNPKYLASAKALGVPAYATLWDDRTLLGRWLRTKASVQKIGGYLCLHGGISVEVVNRGYTLAAMNQSVRDMLSYTPAYTGPNNRYALDDLQVMAGKPSASQADRNAAAFIVLHPLGPLWYRGYFPQASGEPGFPPATSDDIRRVLEHFDARAIFVGHTMVPTVTPLYDGKVIAVQVYPRRDEAGRANMEGLLVKDGALYRARIDGGVEDLPH